LDRFSVVPAKLWIDYCLKHEAYSSHHYAGICRKIDSWRVDACVTIDANADDCREQGGRGYIRMSQRYIYLTFLRHLFHRLESLLDEKDKWNGEETLGLDHVRRIAADFKVLFEEGKYMTFPSAKELYVTLLDSWREHGEKCVTNTQSDLIRAAEEYARRHLSSSQRRMSQQPSLRQILGHTLSHRLHLFPYDDRGITGRPLH
jgi:hypothetical protein